MRTRNSYNHTNPIPGILPRTGIHSGYFGQVPFWKVWIKFTSSVKNFTEQKQKRERVEGETKRPFQKQKIQNVWELKIELEFCHIQKHNSGRCGHKEGDRVYLLPLIFVNSPVFHFDTSWLNFSAFPNTMQGVPQENNKERKNNPQQQKVPFQRTKNITERVKIVISWKSRVVVLKNRTKNHNNGRRGTWRESER